MSNQPNHRITNVVFDLGGVLVSWDPGRIAAALFDEADARRTLVADLFEHPDWHAYDLGILDLAELVERFNDRSRLRIEQPADLLRAHTAALDPLPDSVALLNDLDAAGYRLYCLSNVARPIYDRIAADNPFCRLFTGIVISGDLRFGKPDPAIFRHLLDTHGLQAEQTVMIDDLPQNITGARQAGLHGMVFTSAADCRRRLLGASSAV